MIELMTDFSHAFCFLSLKVNKQDCILDYQAGIILHLGRFLGHSFLYYILLMQSILFDIKYIKNICHALVTCKIQILSPQRKSSSVYFQGVLIQMKIDG